MANDLEHSGTSHKNDGQTIMKHANKLLLIGWDGATWDYIDPMLQAGQLPNLEQLLQKGSRATLRSTIPPFTNIAWPSMATGLRPEFTQVYDGAKCAPDSYRRTPSNTANYQGIPLWHWLNRNGRSTGILNVPMTFPAANLNGYMVTGFDSPRQSANIASPQGILSAWAADGNDYHTDIFLKEIDLMDGQNPHQPRSDLEAFTAGWETLTRNQGKTIAWLWKSHPVDFMFVVFSATDSINHRTNDLSHIQRIYKAADDALGSILDATDEDTILCMVSDHGSTPATHYLALHRLLHDQGWLKFRQEIAQQYIHRVGGKSVAQFWQKLPGIVRNNISWPVLKMNKRLPIAYDNIDWSQTKLFALSSLGPLYINLKGRYPQGCVDPDEYETFQHEIKDYLLGVTSENGRSLIGKVWLKQELFGENADPYAPDLIFEPADWRTHPITGFPTDPILRPIPSEKEYGTHTPDGIFFLKGTGVKQNHTLTGAEISDVFPTLMAAWQLPMPENCTGTVLQDAFEAEMSVKRMAVETAVTHQANNITNADDDEIMNRLKALGYID